MLRGQRFGRLLSALRQSDPEFHEWIVFAKIFEYKYMLADPAPFQKHYLHLLQAHFDLPIITLLLKKEDPTLKKEDPKIASGP